MLDPDPHKTDADPKHWLKLTWSYISGLPQECLMGKYFTGGILSNQTISVPSKLDFLWRTISLIHCKIQVIPYIPVPCTRNRDTNNVKLYFQFFLGKTLHNCSKALFNTLYKNWRVLKLISCFHKLDGGRWYWATP
jgi:hypothetical protein